MNIEIRNELREANDRNWDRKRAELDAMSARLIAEFRWELGHLRTELNTNRSGGRSGLSEDFGILRADMRAAFREQRRWMFFFWAMTLFAVVVADIL